VSYRIEWTENAKRAFRKLGKQPQRRLAKAIDALAEEPRPAGVKKLETTEDLYRIRVGDYRVVYQLQDQALLVLIVRVGDRKDIYR